MAKLLDIICNICAVLAALLLLFVTFSIAYSIVTRQLMLPTPVWVVQFNEYALLWITFLGGAWVLARDKHVAIQLATERLSARGQVIAGMVHNFVGMGLCAVLGWYGGYTSWDHFVRNVIDVGSVDFPKAYVLMVIPIGFLLLTLQFLRKFVADATRLKHAKTQTPS
jgi:TRAP-type C4-dicarboxylate transport system permease small subunit